MVRLAGIGLLACAMMAGVGWAQTKPAGDERQAVIERAHAYISAARALDRGALAQLYAPTSTPEGAKAVSDSIWLAVEVQRLRLAAEKKLGPEPEPGIETEEWGWGILPQRYFDAALKQEPTIIVIEGDHATIWAFSLPPLKKQADGQWLFVTEQENAVAEPDNPELKKALDEKLKSILADIESGKIKSAGDIPRLVWSVIGG